MIVALGWACLALGAAIGGGAIVNALRMLASEPEPHSCPGCTRPLNVGAEWARIVEVTERAEFDRITAGLDES